MKQNNVRYIRNAKTGIEVILCENATISYPLHNHVSVLTIGTVLDGAIILTDSKNSQMCRKYIYRNNETFALLPYAPHSISPQGSYTLLSVCIDKGAAKRYTLDMMQERLAALTAVMASSSQVQQIIHCLETVISSNELYDNQSSPQTLICSDLKIQLEQFPERKLSVEEMAQRVFVSKYHFIRSFKQETGLTPHQFQMQNRIRKAQRLLHRMQSLTEVAQATGFCDQSHFIKQFEKYVGISPRSYKQSSELVEF